MISNLQFWTLAVALVAYVLKYFLPGFPLDEQQILAAVLFVLGLLGIVPQFKVRGFLGVGILQSKAFWGLVAGLIGFIVHYYAPDFPYDDAVVLSVIIFVLNAIGINPELRARGVLK